MPTREAPGARGARKEAPPAAFMELAERLLSLPEECAAAETPEELIELAAERLSSALPLSVSVWWAVDAPPTTPPVPGEMHLPITLQETPLATLVMRSDAELDPLERLFLERMSADITQCVDLLSMRRMGRAVSEVRAAMSADPSLEVFAQRAVAIAANYMRADASLLLLRRSHKFERLAGFGEWPEPPHAEGNSAGEPLRDALPLDLWEAATLGLAAGRPVRHSPSLVSVAIGSRRPYRLVLLLEFRKQRVRRTSAFPVLEELARVCGPYVDSLWRDSLLKQLLELNRSSEETSSAQMYDQVISAALALVPGADSGTLLSRAGPGRPFEYEAARGFDLAALRRRAVSEEAARTWYGPDSAGWHSGTPRIISSIEIDVSSRALEGPGGVDPEAAAYSTIEASLCLPVLRDGEVMAILNLDNRHDVSGFGPDSLNLAALFGPPLASLLHRQRMRALLQEAAFTDDLTGLANRRMFDAALERELARAARHGLGPAVIFMDMRELKQINDVHGHEVGDMVLRAVADAIRDSLREVDVPARLGGDEFLALLVDATAAEAAAAARRIQERVARLELGVGTVEVNAGIASFEQDGGDAGTLVRLADKRMYEEKIGGVKRDP